MFILFNYSYVVKVRNNPMRVALDLRATHTHSHLLRRLFLGLGPLTCPNYGSKRRYLIQQMTWIHRCKLLPSKQRQDKTTSKIVYVYLDEATIRAKTCSTKRVHLPNLKDAVYPSVLVWGCIWKWLLCFRPLSIKTIRISFTPSETDLLKDG